MSAPAEHLDLLLGHAAWLRRLAFALVRDRDAAEDVVQSAFIAAWQKPPAEGGELRPWLGQVARRQALDQRRGEIRRETREQVAGALSPTTAATPEQLVGDLEIHRAVAEAVTALPEPYRQVVLLRYFEGLDASDIAGRLNVPSGTVRWRLKEGLDRVRTALDARFAGERPRWVAALAPLLSELPAGTATSAAPEPAAGTARPAPAVTGSKATGPPLALVSAGAVLVLVVGVLVLRRPATDPEGRGETAAVAASAPAADRGGRKNAGRTGEPPRFAVTAAPRPRERLEGVAAQPESVMRRMLMAAANNDYDTFLEGTDNQFKAVMGKRQLEEVAAQIGPRLQGGFSVEALGTIRQGGALVYLWKLEPGDGGDDLLVKLAVHDEQVVGFRIQ